MNLKLNFSLLKNSKVPIIQIVLGVGAVVFFVLIFPQIRNHLKLSQEVAEKRRILDNLDKGIKNFSALEIELEELSLTNKNFLERSPKQKEFPVFLKLISELARDNNVKIIGIEPKKTVDLPNLFYIQIPVDIDALGKYHDIGRFINDLEFAPKYMKVEDINIDSGGWDSNQHHILLTVNAFCLKEIEKDNILR